MKAVPNPPVTRQRTHAGFIACSGSQRRAARTDRAYETRPSRAPIGRSETFTFAAGAIAGFHLIDRLLDLPAAETPGPIKPINRRQDRVLAGLFDWIAVGAALGAVSLLGDIHGWLLGWWDPSSRPRSICSSRACS